MCLIETPPPKKTNLMVSPPPIQQSLPRSSNTSLRGVTEFEQQLAPDHDEWHEACSQSRIDGLLLIRSYSEGPNSDAMGLKSCEMLRGERCERLEREPKFLRQMGEKEQIVWAKKNWVAEFQCGREGNIFGSRWPGGSRNSQQPIESCPLLSVLFKRLKIVAGYYWFHTMFAILYPQPLLRLGIREVRLHVPPQTPTPTHEKICKLIASQGVRGGKTMPANPINMVDLFYRHLRGKWFK